MFDSNRVMAAFAILVIGLVVAFTSGFLIGATGREPREVAQVPSNWSPALSASNDSLRACMQVIADCHKGDPNANVSH